MEYICRLLGISRQAWYKRVQVNKVHEVKSALLLILVGALRARPGGRKLLHLLQPAMKQMGYHIGREGLVNILAYNGLLIRNRRRCGPETTDSRLWAQHTPTC